MKSCYRWAILTLLLIGAIGFYSVGGIRGAGLFIIIGLIFELLFWVGVFKRKD